MLAFSCTNLFGYMFNLASMCARYRAWLYFGTARFAGDCVIVLIVHSRMPYALLALYPETKTTSAALLCDQ